jgi:hypothetical protein
MSLPKPDMLRLLDEFARLLSRPLDADELRAGWTPEAQAAIGKLVADLRARVAADAPIPDVSLSRGLDSWGVGDGPLSELAARLSNALRDYAQKTRPGARDAAAG